MNEKVKILQSSIKECESHLQRMKRAAQLLDSFFPLTEKSFAQLSEDQVEHIDQFIYRFIKLQDSMGTRFWPSLYALLQQNSNPVPFLNIMLTLEKLNVLKNLEEWQFFRTLRNNLAHDYPESISQTVETLNLLHQRWKKLKDLFTHAQQYVRDFH